jgi:hypothetical protein
MNDEERRFYAFICRGHHDPMNREARDNSMPPTLNEQILEALRDCPDDLVSILNETLSLEFEAFTYFSQSTPPADFTRRVVDQMKQDFSNQIAALPA